MSEASGAATPCPVCGGPIPPSRSRAHKARKQCSDACTNEAARRRHRAKRVALGLPAYPRSKRSPPAPRALVDETGNTYGFWTVLSRAPSRGRMTYWLCRCQCGNEQEVARSAFYRESPKCVECYLRDRRAAARKPHDCPCGRPSTMGHSRSFLSRSPNPAECGACQQRAHRNGRDQDGKPVRDPAFIALPPDGTCAACGEPRGDDRTAKHSPFCGACRGPALRLRQVNRDRLRRRKPREVSA